MIDTSRKALAELGFNLTEEQYRDLVSINIIANQEGKNVPVYTILLTLKALGLIKTDGSKDDPVNHSDDLYESITMKFGRPRNAGNQDQNRRSFFRDFH